MAGSSLTQKPPYPRTIHKKALDCLNQPSRPSGGNSGAVDVQVGVELKDRRKRVVRVQASLYQKHLVRKDEEVEVAG